MYFCQPVAASALSSVSEVCATVSGEVNIVVAALAKTSLAPLTRGRWALSNVVPLSVLDCVLDSLHPPASTAKQTNVMIKPRDFPNIMSPPMVNDSGALVIAEKSKPAAVEPKTDGIGATHGLVAPAAQ